MPTTEDLIELARNHWVRAEALSRMFGRNSRKTGRHSTWLTVCLVVLGAATAFAGALTAIGEHPGLAYVTAALGALSGLLNGIREKILPSDRAAKLWALRNQVSKVQDRFQDRIVALRKDAPKVQDLEAEIKKARDELRLIEEDPLANAVTPEDTSWAKRELGNSISLGSLHAEPESTEEASSDQEEHETPGAGMTRPVRGGVG